VHNWHAGSTVHACSDKRTNTHVRAIAVHKLKVSACYSSALSFFCSSTTQLKQIRKGTAAQKNAVRSIADLSCVCSLLIESMLPKIVKREITVPEQGCKKRTKYGQNERAAVENSRHAARASPSLHGLRGGLLVEQPASCSEVIAVLPWSCCWLSPSACPTMGSGKTCCFPVRCVSASGLRAVVLCKGREARSDLDHDHVPGAVACVVSFGNKVRQPAVCAFAFYLQGPSQA